MSKIISKILNKVGYSVVKRKLQNAGDSDKNMSLLFDYYPEWKSMFDIANENYGGKNDYSTLRISMLNLSNLQEYISFKDKSVIELGPLEAGNTILLEKMNIRSNTSIEGRVESYMKCCMIKNIYELNKTKFFLDDVMNISIDKYGHFDIAVVLGLLYHLSDPLKVLAMLGKMVNSLVLSTHYADETSPYVDAKESIISANGKSYKGRLYIENPQIDPNAGLENYSFWPYEQDLINMCEDSGFKSVNVLQKNIDPNEKYKLIYLVAYK